MVWQLDTGQLEETIASGLAISYGIHVKEIFKLGGNSNINYKVVDVQGDSFVARLSKYKSADTALEEHVLNSLTKTGYRLSPVIVKTLSHHTNTTIRTCGKTYVLHVFTYIQGEVLCKWFEKCSGSEIQMIFKQLACLHKELTRVPYLHPDFHYMHPEIFSLGLNNVTASASVKTYVTKHAHVFMKKAKMLNALIGNIYLHSRHKQYIHGDIHLENILFQNGDLVAFLDFEKVQYAPLELEVVFSAFRTCKYSRFDDKLQYDTEAILLGLNEYTVNNKSLKFIVEDFEKNEGLWKVLFCLDQSFLYLEKAIKGIWTLEEGIGFLPCFNEVLQYEE
ncbi:phosphotransferase [Cytophagaceae bacterium ABcell3]|nr:phosphotransferase [Cytophagaceae bacterium ABcell3]